MGDAGVIENGEVCIDGGRIESVGQGTGGSEAIDLGNAVLLPGFVNAHSHIEYTLGRNTHDGLNFWDWIAAVGFRRDQTPPREVMLASARLGAALCADSGVTCLADCSYSGIAAEAIDGLGLRGIVFKEIFGQSMSDDYPARVALAIEEVHALQSRASERVRIGLSPHAVYTSNSEVLGLCAETCAKLDMPIAMHLAETRAEQEYTASGTGPIADMRRRMGYEPMASRRRPVQVLEDAGLLRRGVSLAHCVHLTDDEIDLIAASGAGVVHCARSNAFLGAGIAPVRGLMSAGARVGLGTDSAASCLTLDFFEEMRFALGIQRARAEDAGVLLAKDVLKLATTGGAEAIGLGDEIGRLEPRMRADMIAVDLGDMLPGEDIHLAVISKSPADVILRLVDGVPVVPDVAARSAELLDVLEQQSIGQE